MVHIVHIVHALGCNDYQAAWPRPSIAWPGPASNKRPAISAAPVTYTRARPLTLIL